MWDMQKFCITWIWTVNINIKSGGVLLGVNCYKSNGKRIVLWLWAMKFSMILTWLVSCAFCYKKLEIPTKSVFSCHHFEFFTNLPETGTRRKMSFSDSILIWQSLEWLQYMWIDVHTRRVPYQHVHLLYARSLSHRWTS